MKEMLKQMSYSFVSNYFSEKFNAIREGIELIHSDIYRGILSDILRALENLFFEKIHINGIKSKIIDKFDEETKQRLEKEDMNDLYSRL